MDITFTTRLRNIMAITSAMKQANPGLESEGGRAQARELEIRVYNRVSSEDEYERECAMEVDALEQSIRVAQPVIDKSKIDPLDKDGLDLGSYRNLTLHKNGLFSTIFKALPKDSVDGENNTSSDLVALKDTRPSAMTAPHNSEREARILKEARCEYVIRLLDTFWHCGGQLVLAFPFMPLDLESLMHRSTVQEMVVKNIVRDLFNALFHLHSSNIIHRDVKPSNILLKSSEGPAYLSDFGTAWSPNDLESEPESNKITDVGTTSYRAPELLFGGSAYDTSLDLWAAGCTVAEVARPSHQSLFHAGDLGSELALIKSIFSTLGTPNEALWPSVERFPDWGKMRFVEYPPKPWTVILNDVPLRAIEFVSRLVRFEGSWRMTASHALKHAWLDADR